MPFAKLKRQKLPPPRPRLLRRLLPRPLKRRRDGQKNKLPAMKRIGLRKKHKLLPRQPKPRRLRKPLLQKRSVGPPKRQNVKRRTPLRPRRKLKQKRTAKRLNQEQRQPKDRPSAPRMQQHGKPNWMQMPQRSRLRWTPIGKPVSLANVSGRQSKRHVKPRRKSDVPKPRHGLRTCLNVQDRRKMKPRRTTVRHWFQSALRWLRMWKTSRMTPS